jgi:hypothetical protein
MLLRDLDLSLQSRTIVERIRARRLDERRRKEEQRTTRIESDLFDVPPGTIESGVVYFVQAVQGGPIKIGSATNLRKRLRAIQSMSPAPLRVLVTMVGASVDEFAIHRHFDAHRLHGEWFEPHADILAFIERVRAGT